MVSTPATVRPAQVCEGWAGSALIGGLLLILLPRFGYSLEVSRTLLFFYATISQLVLAYSARRITYCSRPQYHESYDAC